MKKLMFVIMVFVMAFALLACGGESETSDGETDAVPEVEVEALKSTNGAIEVTVVDGYVAEIGDYYETITVKPEGSEENNSDYMLIEAPGEKGTHENFRFYVY